MKISIFTDDAPVAENVLASGMNRVNTRLFTCLLKNIGTISVTKNHGSVKYHELSNKVIKNTKIYGFYNPVEKLINKCENFLYFKFGINLDISFFFFKRQITKNIISSGAKVLFSPLGADIRSYRRALEVAETAGIPLWVYIVDDFESSASLLNKKVKSIKLHEIVHDYIRRTDKVFSISSGMVNLIEEKYNKKSIMLPLPYTAKYDVKKEWKEQILFLGNLSHFYLDGLKLLLQTVKSINEETGTEIKVRLTTKTLPPDFLEYEKEIEFGRIDGEEKLANEISLSLLCFIPYSFDERYKEMVETSFPSKLIECMAYAKNVFVFAPRGASASIYFNENGLSRDLLTENDPEKLYEMIVDKTQSRKDLSLDYRKLISQLHSYDKVSGVFKNEMAN